jgi:phosphinothricin acetyltransferase
MTPPANQGRPGWTVRPAASRDAVRICEIYNQGIEDGQATLETRLRTPAEIEEQLAAPGQPIVVAEWAGTILGWASIKPYSTRECYATIGEASVYISRSARHQGLGRLLLNGLVRVAEERGYHKLIGRVHADNLASRQLVRAVGFREVGIHEKHGKLNGRWIDVVVVERLIEANLG